MQYQQKKVKSYNLKNGLLRVEYFCNIIYAFTELQIGIIRLASDKKITVFNGSSMTQSHSRKRPVCSLSSFPQLHKII